MRKLAKYVKPYLVLLILAIALLFLQANVELALPDYMSRIVNVGIQQGGIDTAVPEAIRAARLDALQLFLSPVESSQVRTAYELVEPDTPESADYIADYPVLETESIYVLVADDPVELDNLGPVLARGLVALGGLESFSKNPEAAAELMGSIGLDLGSLAGAGAPVGGGAPAPGDTVAGLAMLPEETRLQIAGAMSDRFTLMGDEGLIQAAATLVGNEYEALGMDVADIQTRYIVSAGGLMLLLTLVSAISTIFVGYISARVAAGLSRDLRVAVFERVESYSNREFDKFSTASLITRSTNDIQQIQMVTVMIIRMVFYAPIIGVGGVIRAIGKSSSMWWVIALAVGVLSILILVVYKVAVPKFKIMQKLLDRINLVSREALSGMMVIRAFNMQRHEEGRFDKANQDLTDTTLFVNRVMVIMMPLMMLIMNGLSLLIIWVGAHEVAQSSMQVGDMMAFIQYTMQIVFAFLMLSMMFIMLPRAAVSADRIAEVITTEPTINDPDAPELFDSSDPGTVEFMNVNFRYPGGEEDALHDITFTAPPGKVTAFIGATGSGKSTIANLIPRFYDATEGSVLIGGKDVRTVTQHDLRDRIGYVPQRATLFSGTIATNLRYADENASDEAVEEAALVSQAKEFIDTRPEGMEAEIAQGGANVSGGQKQRLSIARALVKKPPIYIFDDSFSALDFRTDANLRRALLEQTERSTVLIVTQRVSTIKNAEQIIVLDEGRIVGRGTHKELMADCETYHEIATSQLTEEELA